MSLAPSLNTINLDIQPDHLLIAYPVVLLSIGCLSLYLAHIAWWLKAGVFIVLIASLLLLSYKYIFLLRAQSIIKIEYKQQRWFLHYQDRCIKQVELDKRTVYLPFILFLLFEVEGKTQRVIVRRRAADKAQYDALYVYLSRLWQP